MMSKAAIKRILDEMKDPYEGIMYENGKPRKGLWARFRIEDVPFIATALASPAKGGEEEALRKLVHLELPVVGKLFVARGAATLRGYRGVETGPDENSDLVRLSDVTAALQPVIAALSAQDTDGVAKP
jgi:hypothetical protein